MIGIAQISPPVLTTLCVWLVVGVLAGCKPKQAVISVSEPQISTNSVLQTELDRIGDLPFEHDPSRRPLVLSQPASDRRQWALQALEKGYRTTGKTNVLWDRQVQRAFEAFSVYTRVSTTNWPALKEALAAVPSSCNDPMIQYMRVRYLREDSSPEKSAVEFVRAHNDMVRSAHHPVFKFMAGLRAADNARAADKTSTPGNRMNWTTTSLEDLARDTNAPVEEVFETANLWLEHTHAKGWIEYVLSDLGPILDQNWKHTDQWHRFRGQLEIRQAWDARGGGYVDTVNEAGWKGLKEHLEKAAEHLTKAWEMNPQSAATAYQMMRVELGQGQGRSRMEMWFNRIMSLETNHYDAACLMSFYLEPRWYGSEAKALSFARTCVTSDKWGGKVPLVLANLHRSLANYQNLSNTPAYWHRPQVWRDVNSSFEKFFTLNPDSTGWRHDYARDAFNCGQYTVFLEQTKLFAFGTNYEFFGGQKEFERMLATAIDASTNRNLSPP